MSNSRPASQAVLPFLNIWYSKVEDLEARRDAEENPLWKAYWQAVSSYRKTLTSNNPRYNEEKPTEAQLATAVEIDALLEKLEGESDELKAAALNLKGLIQRSLKRDPFPSFEHALALPQLSPLSRAVLQASIGTTLNNQDLHAEALAALEKAQALLPAGDTAALPDQEKQIIAAIYSSLAYGYRKTSQGESANAEAAYQKAALLWLDNRVIQNNIAIRLSKISRIPALQQAYQILNSSFEDARKNFLFVNPYYLADICIKLAAFSENSITEFDRYITQAQVCLTAAQAALDNNKAYSASYIQKAKARLAYLRSNLAMVQGKLDQVANEQKMAAELREELHEERADKREKFLAKFVKPQEPFHPFKLFRRPQYTHGLILSTGMLMQAVDMAPFIGFLLGKAKEENAQFALTPALQGKAFGLANDFNLGKLKPAEFEEQLLAALGISKISGQAFWDEWNKMIKIGAAADKGLVYHLQLLQKEKGQARVYLCSDTNPVHLDKLAAECKDQAVALDLSAQPPRLASFPLYTSCDAHKSRFELIQHVVDHLRTKELRGPHPITLVLGDPANIQNELGRDAERAKQAPIVEWCRINDVGIVYHRGNLEDTLKQALSQPLQPAATRALAR